MKIVAAIPNYRNKDSLINLVSDLERQNLDKIYVFDDCSPEIVEIEKELSKFKKVKLIKSNKRLLPNRNRARIIKENLGDIILFIDSDMGLITKDLRQVLEDAFKDTEVGLVGGLILEDGNKQMKWNFGLFQFPIDNSRFFNWTSRLNEYFSFQRLKNTIDTDHLIPRKIGWSAEGLFAIRSDLFRKLDGFDENFSMYHEGPDLFLRARKNGYKTLYWPRLSSRHLEIKNLNDDHRDYNMIQSSAYWFYKHYHLPKKLVNFLFKYKGKDVL